ncbi:hypothetical protein S40285_10257 [Stachybotrys chlorohalonatus IBT 40285]|uniref:Uncharacterized protein n=1 Tax=Stachybotrys chlorohalonatus (strain IBT 40285) TaxID=1283841 RepID=A0A084QUK5_STAC4|nr:hypothetical protein S40285_10257 [Stachybotrys chlorohalonata IBT 40285]
MFLIPSPKPVDTVVQPTQQGYLGHPICAHNTDGTTAKPQEADEPAEVLFDYDHLRRTAKALLKASLRVNIPPHPPSHPEALGNGRTAIDFIHLNDLLESLQAHDTKHLTSDALRSPASAREALAKEFFWTQRAIQHDFNVQFLQHSGIDGWHDYLHWYTVHEQDHAVRYTEFMRKGCCVCEEAPHTGMVVPEDEETLEDVRPPLHFVDLLTYPEGM